MKNLSRLLPVLLFVLSAIITIRTIWSYPLSPDSYLHLSVGKFITYNGHIPHHRDLSFKAVQPSLEFVAHSWLGDWIYYAAYSDKSPHYLIVGLLVALLGVSIYFVQKTLSALNTRAEIQYVLLSLLVLNLLSFWRVHPLMFAVTIMSYIVYIYTLWSLTRSRVIWTMPLAFVLYANTAGGYIIIPTIYVLTMALWQLFSLIWHKNNTTGIILPTLASIFASLINPLFIFIYVYAITLLSVLGSARKIFSTLIGVLKISNQNYIKTSNSTIYYALFLIGALILLFAAGSLLIRQRKRFFSRGWFLLPSVAWILLAMYWIRFIPITSIIIIPLGALCIQQLTEFTDNKIRKILFISSYICVFVLTEYLLMFPPTLPQVTTPVQQLTAIDAFKLPNNLLTSPELTSQSIFYLGRRTMLDAQDDLYDEEENTGLYIYNPQIDIPEFDRNTKKNDIHTLLIDRDFGELPRILSISKRWALIYFDYSGFLYVDKNVASQDIIHRYALEHMRFDKELGYEPKYTSEVERELELFVSRYPSNTMARGQLATIYRMSHKYSQAEQLLLGIPESERNYVVYTELGRLYGAQGRCVQSRDAFEQALNDRHEQNLSRSILDLAVIHAACFKDTQEAARYLQRYLSFPLPQSERDRATKILGDFGVKVDSQ